MFIFNWMSETLFKRLGTEGSLLLCCIIFFSHSWLIKVFCNTKTFCLHSWFHFIVTNTFSLSLPVFIIEELFYRCMTSSCMLSIIYSFMEKLFRLP